MSKPRLTVLQVIPAMQSGGAELGALQVAEALVRDGHRALLASEGGRMIEPLIAAGAEHFDLPVASKNPFVVWRNAHRLAKLIRDERVDILHARSRAPAWSCLWASRWTQIPFVTTYHSGYSEENALKRFYNSVMVKGDRVIAVSNWIADVIIGRYKADPTNVVVIHRAVDPDVFDPGSVTEARRAALRQTWGIATGAHVVLLPGRLARRKGQDNLIRAVAAIREKVPPFVCILAGEDQGKTGFRETAEALSRKLGVDDIVKFVGHVEDMPAAYSLATVSVSAAIAPEGFQRGMLEAQAMASPVVVSDVGPGVEVVLSPPRYPTVEATGLNYDGRSFRALADALELILTMPDGERRAMGLRGSGWVRSEYTRQRLTRATLALYEELASSAPAKAAKLGKGSSEPARPTVLQIVPRLDTGGAEQTTVDIAAAVVKAGGRAIVASEGGRYVSDIVESGAEWLRFPAATKNPLRMIRNAARLRSLIHSEKVSIVHARSRAPAWSALFAVHNTDAALVTTYHGAYNEGHPLKRLYNSVMARSDAVIANSGYTADLIQRRHRGIARHLHVVPRGIDLGWFDAGTVGDDRLKHVRRTWRLTGTEQVVLLPARITWWKGHEVVIDVAVRMRGAGHENLVFVFAGDIQRRADFLQSLRRHVDELDLHRTVRFVGHCSDMPAAYAVADCVIVPSTEPEAFGRTAVEAQAMGKPVIVSNIGATPETVLAPPAVPNERRTGWQTPARDVGAICAALEDVFSLNEEDRTALASRARAHVAGRFSVDAMATATLDIYDRLRDLSLRADYEAAAGPGAVAPDKQLDLPAK